MKQIRYSRKIKQFRNTARQVNELIESRRWQTLTESSKHQFQWKLNNLFATVRNLLCRKELKKILASAAFLICIGTVNAQSFAPSVTNPFGLTSAGTINLPYLSDLDGDGDLDIITLFNYGQIKFYENTGTASAPVFTAPQINPFGISYSSNGYRPVTADIDDDGDMDLFTGEYYGAYKYFQNTGTATNPAFAAPTTNPFGLDSANEVGFPSFADLDNDGDLDLLATEYYGVFMYYQNNGTASSPNFAVPTTNPYSLYPASLDAAFPTTCDLDGDGDFDILTGGMNDNSNFYFYQNTGTNTAPTFAYSLTNPFGLTMTCYYSAPTFGDMDNDGDYDLIVGGDSTGNFIYFENTTISSTENYNNNSLTFSVYPNPANEYIRITTYAAENKFNLSIINVTGKLIYEYLIGDTETVVNTTGFSKGVYIIELSDGNKVSRKKLVIE